MKFKFAKKGLILTEALVSVAMLTIGVVVMSTIITNAVSATITSKDYLVAQNLVTEAIEGVKSARATNWMAMPDRRDCWLVLDPQAGNCDSKVVVGTNYIVIPEDGGWKLAAAGANALDLKGGVNQAPYLLHIQTIGETSKYIPSFPININNPSKFYRSVNFVNPPAGCNPGDYCARVEVKVEWLDGAKVRSFKIDSPLYNYL